MPGPFADTLILRAIRETGGTAVAVSEDDLIDGMVELSRREGCLACPEGGATLAALRQLKASGEVSTQDRVVLYNTGSGLQYPDVWRIGLERAAQAARTPS